MYSKLSLVYCLLLNIRQFPDFKNEDERRSVRLDILEETTTLKNRLSFSIGGCQIRIVMIRKSRKKGDWRKGGVLGRLADD